MSKGQPRIPKVRAIIGSIEDVFGTTDTTGFVGEYTANVLYNNYASNPNENGRNIEYISAINALGIKGVAETCHTFLKPAPKEHYKLKEAVKFYWNRGQNSSQPSDICFYWKQAKKSNIYYILDESILSSDKKTIVSKKGIYRAFISSNGSWEECIPTNKDDKKIHIAQVKPNSWVITRVESVYNQPTENDILVETSSDKGKSLYAGYKNNLKNVNFFPSFVIEVDRKPNKNTNNLDIKMDKLFTYDQLKLIDDGVTKNTLVDGSYTDKDIIINNPVMNIVVGEYVILLQSGNFPTIFHRPSMETLQYDKTIDLKETTNFKFVVKSYNGLLVISCPELFTGDWVVKFTKSINIPDKKAIIGVNFCGMGVMNFSYAPIWYPTSSNSYTATHTHDNSIYESLLSSAAAVVRSPELYSEDLNTIAIPSTSGHIKNQIITNKTNSISVYNIIGTSNILYSDIMFSNNMFNTTPLLKRYTCQSDYTFKYNTGAATYVDYHIESLSVESSLDGISKINRSGNITFSNRKVGRGDEIDWKSMSSQKAIKLEFAWDYLEDNKEEHELDWKPLFTGFLTNPAITNGKYGDSTISYKMSDMWHQLNDSAIINSKFYDGVQLSKAVLDLLNLGQLPNNLVRDVGYTNISTEFTDANAPILPLKPGIETNPQFKWKTGEKIDSGITKLIDYAPKMLLFFDRSGIFNMRTITEVVNMPPVVFRNYINPTDEDISKYDNLYSPWKEAFAHDDLQRPWNNVQNANYTKDTESIYNDFYTYGWKSENNNNLSFIYPMHVVDGNSITNTDAFNYIGYRKTMIDGNIAYMDQQKMIERTMWNLYIYSQPIIRYSFTTQGNLLEPFTPIKVYENTDDPNAILTGINDNVSVYIPSTLIEVSVGSFVPAASVIGVMPTTPNFSLVSNRFSYDYKSLKAISEMTIELRRGLYLATLDYKKNNP